MAALSGQINSLRSIFNVQVLILLFLHPQSGRTFDSQRMNCDIIRIQFFQLSHRLTHILDGFLRKSHDQIHIDIVKTNLPCKFETVDGLLHRMLAADET